MKNIDKELTSEAKQVLRGRKIEELAIEVIYKNWRGVEKVRKILPLYLYHGSTQWYKKPQWLLRVYDLDKNSNRDYSLKNIKGSPDYSNKIQKI